MIELKIIEPSNSPYCSPVVMIAKGDGGYRLAIDFRILNSITVFDSEPMPTIEHDLHKFINAKLITELFFMNGNTERAQCALSLVCIPQEMEMKGSEKNKTSL